MWRYVLMLIVLCLLFVSGCSVEENEVNLNIDIEELDPNSIEAKLADN